MTSCNKNSILSIKEQLLIDLYHLSSCENPFKGPHDISQSQLQTRVFYQKSNHISIPKREMLKTKSLNFWFLMLKKKGF